MRQRVGGLQQRGRPAEVIDVAEVKAVVGVEPAADAGELEARRRTQQVDWTWQMVRDTVLDRVLSNPEVRKVRAEVERQVKAGELTPAMAAQRILNAASI